MNILMIRGGSLGDFVVTLPTLRLLREKWPEARIELLGYPRLGEIALKRYYLDGVRSVNHGPLSTFFMPRAILDPDWMDYIGGFDLVLSYFYDPDQLFITNLQRCNPGRIITEAPRVPDIFREPAARHFARITEPLGLNLGEDAASRLFPSTEDIAAARAFLNGIRPDARLVAIHPGSGSETKNWPPRAWAEFGRRLVHAKPDVMLLLIEGEVDAAPAQFLMEAWKDLSLLRARWLPLPVLAALLREAALWVGHDSGVTHLAAAARYDLPVIVLFGPTDPAVWAPPRPGVRVLRGIPNLYDLTVEDVLGEASAAL
ncbi:MAG TPA: glycosyltransferase family 9 protein [Candidatus Methylacidiphilales bacterium]|nr:glycosyltransferase family 9 protein [Candidatus Methylacidiphilales bacterium]